MLLLPLSLLTVGSSDTPRPIIGVLALPVEHSDCITLRASSPGKTSCFHSLYVKWIEQAGARVAPIPYDLPLNDFDELIGQLNGALITGGEADIKELDSPYMLAARRLYNHSLSLHSAGETWPLWGTCMGFQVRWHLRQSGWVGVGRNGLRRGGSEYPYPKTAGAVNPRRWRSLCPPLPRL